MARQLQARVFAVNPETGETRPSAPATTSPRGSQGHHQPPPPGRPPTATTRTPTTRDSGDGNGEPAKPYSKWLKSDLQDELDRRNAGRDDEDLLDAEVDGKVTVASLAPRSTPTTTPPSTVLTTAQPHHLGGGGDPAAPEHHQEVAVQIIEKADVTDYLGDTVTIPSKHRSARGAEQPPGDRGLAQPDHRGAGVGRPDRARGDRPGRPQPQGPAVPGPAASTTASRTERVPDGGDGIVAGLRLTTNEKRRLAGPAGGPATAPSVSASGTEDVHRSRDGRAPGRRRGRHARHLRRLRARASRSRRRRLT